MDLDIFCKTISGAVTKIAEKIFETRLDFQNRAPDRNKNYKYTGNSKTFDIY